MTSLLRPFDVHSVCCLMTWQMRSHRLLFPCSHCCCCHVAYAGALTGLLGAFLASSWVNRHSVYTSRAQVVSVLQTIGINLALMTIFGGHMDNW